MDLFETLGTAFGEVSVSYYYHHHPRPEMPAVKMGETYLREASLSRFCRSEYVQGVFHAMQFWQVGFSRPHRT